MSCNNSQHGTYACTIARQSKCLADALFEKNELVERLRKTEERLSHVTMELAKYVPSPSKFKLNQVLAPVAAFYVIKVSRAYHNGVQWVYTDTCNRQWGESDLRALTPEERGQ